MRTLPLIATLLVMAGSVLAEPAGPSSEILLHEVSAEEFQISVFNTLRQRFPIETIERLPAPLLGYRWREGSYDCGIRAIPAAGINRDGQRVVGYYFEYTASGRNNPTQDPCQESTSLLMNWQMRSGWPAVRVSSYHAVGVPPPEIWKEDDSEREEHRIIDSLTKGSANGT